MRKQEQLTQISKSVPDRILPARKKFIFPPMFFFFLLTLIVFFRYIINWRILLEVKPDADL